MIKLPKFVHSLYCDDVRFEADGKTTFVGAYRNLNVQGAAPVVIPKICVAVTVQVPCEDEVDRVIIKLMKDDDAVIQKVELPEDIVRQQVLTEVGAPPPNYYVFGGIISLKNYPIDASCVLRVVVDVGEETELMASGLRITLSPDTPELSAPN